MSGSIPGSGTSVVQLSDYPGSFDVPFTIFDSFIRADKTSWGKKARKGFVCFFFRSKRYFAIKRTPKETFNSRLSGFSLRENWTPVNCSLTLPPILDVYSEILFLGTKQEFFSRGFVCSNSWKPFRDKKYVTILFFFYEPGLRILLKGNIA